MKQFILLTILLLSGCKSTEQINQERHNTCAVEYGLKRGTLAYAQCRKSLDDYYGKNFLDGVQKENARRNAVEKPKLKCTTVGITTTCY